MKRERSPQELADLDWRPTRIYSSRLEAWPTHYPEWWEPPQRQRPGAVWIAVAMGVVLGLFLI